MKKSILFLGTFALAFSAIAFFASFEDANQAKIDAKFDELKTKMMEEEWTKCTSTVMADAQAEYDEFAAANAPEPTDDKTTARTTKPRTTTGGNTTTTTTGGNENTQTSTTTTTTPTKDPKTSKMGGETNTTDKKGKIGGETNTTDKKSKMGGK